jgi:hypothetical protein
MKTTGVAVFVAAAMLTACGASQRASNNAPLARGDTNHHSRMLGGSGLLGANGAIGPLHIDRSTAAQVQAFAGPAQYIGAGRFVPRIHQFAPFIALGYGCKHVASGGIPTMTVSGYAGSAPGDSHVKCQTVYFVNQRTEKLAGFATTSRRFYTAAGVRVGTTIVAAKHREHRVLMEDPKALDLHSADADLLIYAAIVVPKHGNWYVGKSISEMNVESNHHMIGLQFI